MELINIKGIGAVRAAQLNKLGIFSAEDLIAHFPRDYLDRGKLSTISEADEQCSIKAEVTGVSISRPNKKVVVKATLADETGVLEAVWFNQPYMKNAFKESRSYIFTGRVSERLGRKQLQAPDYEPYNVNAPRILPVYHATAGLSQKVLRGLVRAALDMHAENAAETLERGITEKYGLCQRGYAVRNIHFPENDRAFFRARERLVFEELFTAQLKLMRLKNRIRQPARGIEPADLAPVLNRLPYSPTAAQARVLDEIVRDLHSGFRMNRLVQGDVGSGKTLVALLAAYTVIMSGMQVALMAPTEVLAEQHLRSFWLLNELGIKTAFLSGSQSRGERARTFEDIESGRARMIIGTHAIIQPGVRFNGLGLAITDEQHRFGVRQRFMLSDKASPHVLVMSATPIPRSLGLILYGDMDISVIDSLPPGRQAIKTHVVNSGYRGRLYNFIRERLAQGRQAYIICPAIDSDGLESVTALGGELVDEFRGYTVGTLHGRMKPEQRQETMAAFARGQIDVLVSTTVIEVGVNVPNATVMVVENAERFGLAQLHQLRGRVGRGEHESWCILVTDSTSKLCTQRLTAMKNSSDGFYISELDLKLRGAGDFFGTRQHGLPEFKLANLYTDMGILKKAQQAAAEQLAGEGADWVVL